MERRRTQGYCPAPGGSPARRLRACGSARRRATAPRPVGPETRRRQRAAATPASTVTASCTSAGRPPSSRAGIVSPRQATGQGRSGLRPPRRCAMAQAPPWTADLPRRESAPITRTGEECEQRQKGCNAWAIGGPLGVASRGQPGVLADTITRRSARIRLRSNQIPKLTVRVRFSSPAPHELPGQRGCSRSRSPTWLSTVARCATNVPLARRAGPTYAPLGLGVRVDRIRNSGVRASGLMLVDHGSARCRGPSWPSGHAARRRWW